MIFCEKGSRLRDVISPPPKIANLFDLFLSMEHLLRDPTYMVMCSVRELLGSYYRCSFPDYLFSTTLPSLRTADLKLTIA